MIRNSFSEFSAMFCCLFFSNSVLPIPCIHLFLMRSGPLFPNTVGIYSASSLLLASESLTPFLAHLILIPFSAISKYLLNHLQPREITNTWGPCPRIAHSLREIGTQTLCRIHLPCSPSFSACLWALTPVYLHFPVFSQFLPASSCGPSPTPSK